MDFSNMPIMGYQTFVDIFYTTDKKNMLVKSQCIRERNPYLLRDFLGDNSIIGFRFFSKPVHLMNDITLHGPAEDFSSYIVNGKRTFIDGREVVITPSNYIHELTNNDDITYEEACQMYTQAQDNSDIKVRQRLI